MHAEDDGCANRTGCNAHSAGAVCHQPCMAGQAFAAPSPSPGQAAIWRPLSTWGGKPNPLVPGTSCARLNLTAEGEAVCIGWLWKPNATAPGSFVTQAGQYFKFDAHGSITWWNDEVEMSMSGWPPELNIGSGDIQTGSSNLLALPDGSLFQTVYFSSVSANGTRSKLNLAAILSTDGQAKEFRFMSLVAPWDPKLYDNSWGGLSESSSAVTQSQKVRVVYRVHSQGPSTWVNYFTTVSAGVDEAGLKQWTVGKPLTTSPIASARPVLQSLRLPDGSARLLLVGGRPSIHLYLSLDGEGERWAQGINVATQHNAHFGNDSKYSFCKPMLSGVQGCPCPEIPSLGCNKPGHGLSGTTGYTSLVPLQPEQGSARFMLVCKHATAHAPCQLRRLFARFSACLTLPWYLKNYSATMRRR